MLSVAGCINVDDGALGHIARISSLESLDLDSCNLITDQGVAALATLSRLNKLMARWCYNLSDTACSTFSVLPLSEHELEGCEKIGDDGIHAIANSRTFRDLGLPDFANVTDAGIDSLATGNIPLEIISFLYLRRVTGACVIKLVKSKNLRKMLLRGMPGISVDVMAELECARA